MLWYAHPFLVSVNKKERKPKNTITTCLDYHAYPISSVCNLDLFKTT